MAKKELIINAFVESCSGHQSPGLWSHPRDKSWDFNNIKHWVELAQKLEKGKLHGIFIADVLVCLITPESVHSTQHSGASVADSPVRVPMMSTRDPRTPTLLLFLARNGL